MATVVEEKGVLRFVAVLAGLCLCGCTWYPPTRAHVTVATINCALPEAPVTTGAVGTPVPAGAATTAEAPVPGGAPGPAEAGPPRAEAQPKGGAEPAAAPIELVPPSAPTGEEATEQLPAARAPAELPTGVEAEEERAAEMERHLAHLARLIKATRADIVVLQGVPSPEALDSLEAKLAKMGWHREFQGYAFFAEESGEPAGIVVLSARPLISFHPPEAPAGSVLAQMQYTEARIQLPGKQELVLYSFRLHREPSLQLEEAKALYELTLPLRRRDVNLMLAGCLNSAEPYRPAPTEAAGTADRVLSGANTPSRGDDLVDLDAYLWPDERATGPAGAECCRILVSPELTTDTYKKVDWYLKGVKTTGDKKAAGDVHRALVVRFGLR